MMPLPNEKELLAQFAEYDDEKAFKTLFVAYYPVLLSFSFTILGSTPLAEESVSDVFIKIWTQRKSIRPIINLKLYLYVAVRNQSLNALEKLRRERTIWIEESQVEFRSAYTDPEQQLLSVEMWQTFYKAVAELPPKCQMIFKLVKEDELSYREAADVLELSVKTIENQMGIALKKLSSVIPGRIIPSSEK